MKLAVFVLAVGVGVRVLGPVVPAWVVVLSAEEVQRRWVVCLSGEGALRQKS